MKDDVTLRQEFAAMVQATERAAAQLARPWEIACAVLAVVAVLAAFKKR